MCDFGSATSRVLHPGKHGPLRCQEEIENSIKSVMLRTKVKEQLSGLVADACNRLPVKCAQFGEPVDQTVCSTLCFSASFVLVYVIINKHNAPSQARPTQLFCATSVIVGGGLNSPDPFTVEMANNDVGDEQNMSGTGIQWPKSIANAAASSVTTTYLL
ncbi:unnamed protein product [Dibothriocephalus latus]|uniref:Uncharacterized protein n=1 Tax=Dibothriocephalus latus TaxID=60516 RepID=A0A3P7RLW6_DIBLA|nr:unnamed protein product [Dibothriocephalus latus]